MLYHYVLIGLSRVAGIFTACTPEIHVLASSADLARTMAGHPGAVDIWSIVSILPADTFGGQ